MAYGLKEAKYVEAQLDRLGIRDIRLLWDNQAQLWAVCHVLGHAGILLPDTYQDVKPQILFWVKDAMGRRRLPSDQDVSDVVALRQRAEVVWRKGEDWLADRLDEQSAEKDRKHRQKQHDMIHDIAKPMKKAIREELW